MKTKNIDLLSELEQALTLIGFVKVCTSSGATLSHASLMLALIDIEARVENAASLLTEQEGEE